MKRTTERGHTLLVDGPASVNLLSGEVEVLGALLEIGFRTVVREGKRVAFEVKKKAHFDLTVAENASVEEFRGSTIPASWEKACITTLAHNEKPVTILILGEVDSGKTSFCTYLSNRALRERRKVAIIDADLGQSDIGPPSTIGFCHLTQPITDLFFLKAEIIFFIGTTTPSRALSKIIDELGRMKDESLRKDVNFLTINTDGWVLGEEAVQYKLRLIQRVAPNVVVGIQRQSDLVPLLTALKGIKVVSIESPSTIKKRDREERKILRELSYKKYLKGAKVQSFPLSQVKVEGKKVKLIREGDEEGLLVGLYDEEVRFLGIGVLNKIDYGKRMIQIHTPVAANVSFVNVGQVKLDKQGREIGMSQVFIDYYTSA